MGRLGFELLVQSELGTEPLEGVRGERMCALVGMHVARGLSREMLYGGFRGFQGERNNFPVAVLGLIEGGVDEQGLLVAEGLLAGIGNSYSLYF